VDTLVDRWNGLTAWLATALETLVDNADLFRTGFWTTLQLLVLSGILSVLLGTLLAAMRVSPVPALRRAGGGYVTLLRNTPLTVLFFLVVFGFPPLGIDISFFARAVVALSVYTAAFVCEAVRSGINTVHVGQAEAARAIGMRFSQTLRYVILPQAVRSVLPPLASVIIALAKNTTVAAGFSVLEAGAVRGYLSERGYPVVAGLFWVTIGFLLIVFPLSLAQRRLESRWAVAR
jgi:glutamate transport system permease protein